MKQKIGFYRILGKKKKKYYKKNDVDNFLATLTH